MLTNRAFLLACATIAGLGLAAACSTPADARPCHTENSTPREEKACQLKAAITAAISEAAEQAAAAKQAAAKQAAAKQAATNAPAAKCGSATTNATTPAAPAVVSCLTKEYLNGTVIFRDTCTGEWAQR